MNSEEFLLTFYIEKSEPKGESPSSEKKLTFRNSISKK